jgi:hypothetical protein
LIVASKKVRNSLQDVIHMKNVKAVLMGSVATRQIMASWNWQRSDGILIQVEMETNGRTIVAIINTGSQLDVVRSDVAALIIQQPVDLSKITNMNDANGGGKGRLQGMIDEVEFSCGGLLPKLTYGYPSRCHLNLC